jgi:hypothetical protein
MAILLNEWLTGIGLMNAGLTRVVLVQRWGAVKLDWVIVELVKQQTRRSEETETQ